MMNIEITQKLDKEYYLEYYHVWLKYGNKYKKYERILGILLVIFGIFWRFFLSNFKDLVSAKPELLDLYIPIIFAGVFTIFNFYLKKNKWLKKKAKDKLYDVEIKIIFNENEMLTFSELGNSSLKWESFSDIIDTEKGIFFVLKNKASIYVKKNSVLNKNDIDKIIAKIK